MNTTYKLIIIGSGPAAHTAAIYAARAELNPLLFEGFMAGGVAAGGQLTTTTEVENFPGFPDGISGPELMERMRAQSLRVGATIITETVTSVDCKTSPFSVRSADKNYLAQCLIIATGATAKRLGIEGEETYWQKGISACAVCDGALAIFHNKPLVVIGGGDSACEETLYLTKYAQTVTMLVRRDVLRASKAMQKRVLEHPKIKILWKTQAIKAQGSQLLESLVVHSEGIEKEIPANGLFYAVGHKPNIEFLDRQLELDETGYIKTSDRLHSSVQGILACGDVQDKIYRQAITAAGSGCMAALEAERFLNELK
ncbi:hypothetical protein LSH36_793g00032 [Paralvinella palmiformis]|uniref:Thioredoxin reductase n=1 Tax=Paralvinella palmiformis TaxID=53620 RepID=A0AAD9J0T9_9ANNE|nr:hypothetical protein LSH36_793g00032 [Paralvinella palmiformis]